MEADGTFAQLGLGSEPTRCEACGGTGWKWMRLEERVECSACEGSGEASSVSEPTPEHKRAVRGIVSSATVATERLEQDRFACVCEPANLHGYSFLGPRSSTAQPSGAK